MIIGLVGKKGSGKDYFSTKFVEKHPEYIRIAFADVLRNKLSAMFNINPLDFDNLKRYHNVKWGKYNIDGRHFYREIGMLMVDLQPTLFMDYVEDIIKSNKNVIITDVRREREVKLLKGYNCQFVNILGGEQLDKHETESLEYIEGGLIYDNTNKNVSELEEFINDNF